MLNLETRLWSRMFLLCVIRNDSHGQHVIRNILRLGHNVRRALKPPTRSRPCFPVYGMHLRAEPVEELCPTGLTYAIRPTATICVFLKSLASSAAYRAHVWLES